MKGKSIVTKMTAAVCACALMMTMMTTLVGASEDVIVSGTIAAEGTEGQAAIEAEEQDSAVAGEVVEGVVIEEGENETAKDAEKAE